MNSKKSILIKIFLLSLISISIISINSTIVASPADTQTVNTKTRRELLTDFIKKLKTEDGFRNSLEDANITLESTYYGIVISDFLQIEYSTYDIIYMIQSLQQPNYGFANTKNTNASLSATYYAVRSLVRLGVSSETLQRWKIFNFINSTIAPVLYNTTNYSKLTVEDLDNICEFLEMSVLLNVTVVFPYNTLISSLKAFQYTNGTYQSFNIAISNIKLLNLLNQKPDDVAGAINFVKAFRFNETGFASDRTDNITITDTYDAIQVLQILGSEIGAKQRIVDSILKFQHNDGGFSEIEKSVTNNLKSTYYAYLILLELNAIGQLDQLAFLASTGYLPGFTFGTVISLILLLGAIAYKRKNR